jgi:hypothetical protein
VGVPPTRRTKSHLKLGTVVSAEPVAENRFNLHHLGARGRYAAAWSLRKRSRGGERSCGETAGGRTSRFDASGREKPQKDREQLLNDTSAVISSSS